MKSGAKLNLDKLKAFLDAKVDEVNRPGFIKDDPISIPHAYSRQQDIEIAGLFAAILAWGQRKTIIRKCTELLTLMDNAPHQFILGHKQKDLKRFGDFRHRTFNPIDTLYFMAALKSIYKTHTSLEDLFLVAETDETIEKGLINFHDKFFSLPEFPQRTRKHVATPVRKSTCKRMAMYLRWMVRVDNRGVDFGIWNRISPAKLVCPCDVHVERVARKLKLITRKQTDWQTVLELTASLRKLDPADPVKYDFALFGLGVDREY